MTVWNVLRALVGLESGRTCRSCDDAISRVDPFGRSEGVCGPCRGAAA
jgi:hypothetical protein